MVAPRSFSSSGVTALLGVILVVAALYFAQAVFIPLALALLFSFLLAPLVVRLRHWHVGRVPWVLAVVLLAFLIVGSVGGLMVSQMVDLANKLPGYQENIHKKMRSLNVGEGGVLRRVSNTITELRKDLAPMSEQRSQVNGIDRSKPVPVEIHSSFTPIEVMRKLLGSIFTIGVTAFVVVVFVIFMLVEREDLRDRLIRFIGTGHLNVTTQLLDDAAHRVSRYLLMQLVVNVIYGFPIAIGLYFIGIPNPLLWGLLAALLRYIPYAGAWIATAMPLAIALAVDPGWTKPLLTFGLFLLMEIIVANVVEPYVYGVSTGITPLGVLLAAVFWTWLWGPVGLFLSTPLTVCLVTVGRYVPNFGFLNILLGDEPVLSPAARLYQRMLAMDQEEATELSDNFLREHSLTELYDVVFIPALALAEEDRQHGALQEHKYSQVLQNIHFLVDDISESRNEVKMADRKEGDRSPWLQVAKEETAKLDSTRPSVLCIPARSEADEIVATMLAQLLEERQIPVKVISATRFTAEKAEMVKDENAGLICISAMAPTGLLHARHLLKRLLNEVSEGNILIGLWNEKQATSDLSNRLPSITPDNIVVSLKIAVERILPRITTSATKTPESQGREISAGVPNGR